MWNIIGLLFAFHVHVLFLFIPVFACVSFHQSNVFEFYYLLYISKVRLNHMIFGQAREQFF